MIKLENKDFGVPPNYTDELLHQLTYCDKNVAAISYAIVEALKVLRNDKITSIFLETLKETTIRVMSDLGLHYYVCFYVVLHQGFINVKVLPNDKVEVEIKGER